MLILFVLSYKTWNAAKPGAWLTRSPPGGQQSQDSFPHLIHSSASLELTAGSHSQSILSQGSVQAG